MSDIIKQEVVKQEAIKQEAVSDKIKIADEVLESITGMIISEVSNVSSTGSGIADGIAGILGKKTLSKGIKVEVAGNDIKVDISLSVTYGTPIHVTARQIQRRVREALEASTGMQVSEVNVNIVGLSFEKDGRKEEISEDNPR